MSLPISFLNALAVSLFGSVLSASFCGALERSRNRLIFWCCMAMIPIFQGAVSQIWDAEFLRYIYPIIMHLPLLLVLRFLAGKLLWPLISILTAYLCCELRRWIALLFTGLFQGGDMMQDIAELIVTLPLFFLLLRFFSPVIRQLSERPLRLQWQFGIVPATYYIFDYGARVYTDLLYSGSPITVEFMPLMCCVTYILFLLYFTTEERRREQLQQVQKGMEIQVAQAVREVGALRESQELACRYRHDLRHHLQYISASIANGQQEQAQIYISGICEEIDAQKVKRYCENETANLILSAFAGRVEKVGIRMDVQGSLPAFILISDSDLCVILSNALENALHACQPLVSSGRDCLIDVQFYEREKRLFLQVINPYQGSIRFENGIPVSDREDHGIGTRSIRAIVQKYGGVCSFLAQDGRFILRLSI